MEAVRSSVTIRCRNNHFINKPRETSKIFNIQIAINSFQNVTMSKCFATFLAKYKLYSQGN
jgi:predicted nucleic-acid-binding Zn-ribbon protein